MKLLKIREGRSFIAPTALCTNTIRFEGIVFNLIVTQIQIESRDIQFSDRYKLNWDDNALTFRKSKCSHW